MKKILSFLLALTLLLSFSGCTTELYNQILVQGFGIDRVGDEYRVTVRYASMQEKKGEEQVSVRGKTVYDALNDLSLTTGKKQMYAAASFIIVGRGLAESGLDTSLDFFIRYFKTRPTIALYMADGTAAEIMEMKKDEQYISSDTILSYTNNQENKGKTASSTVLRFVNDVKSRGVSAVVPVIKRTGEDLTCETSAVFDGYKLDAELDRLGTVGYLAGKGELVGSSLVVEEERGEFTVDITKTSAKINYEMGEEGPKFKVTIDAEAVLASYPLEKPGEHYETIEEELSGQIQRCVEKALDSTLPSKSDILGLGYKFFVKDPKNWKIYEKDWKDRLPDLTVDIAVHSRIIRIGQEEKPPS